MVTMFGRLIIGLASLVTGPVYAQSAPQARAFSVAASATAEVWQNLQGGVTTGSAVLTSADVVADLDGAGLGHPDWTAQASMVATNGHLLSAKLGDIQAASNIEHDGALHLYEAWVRKQLSPGSAVKIGVLDLNSDFDTNETAALFINSAHGIGPDISGSGRVGPAVWPMGTAGIMAQTTPIKDLTIKAGIYNGVPRDTDHPRAFAAINRHPGDGVMAIGQADRTIAADTRLALGIWHYSADLAPIDPEDIGTVAGQTGIYATLEGPVALAPQTRGWIRLGKVDANSAQLSGFLGAGLVKRGLFAGRPEDLIGLAIARAQFSAGARRAGGGLTSAETAIELTYSSRVSDRLAIQPDLQYIIHPGGDRTLDDALVIGVRVFVQTP